MSEQLEKQEEEKKTPGSTPERPRRGTQGQINRISRCFTLYRNNQLEQEGVNGYQHVYILHICRSPGISQDQLAREIYVHKSSVARQLAILEQNGFVTRTSCKEDRRQLLIYPTEKAKAILPAVRAVLENWNAEILADFSEQEQEALADMLEKIEGRAKKMMAGAGKETGMP